MERIDLNEIFNDDGTWDIMPSEIVEALKVAYFELDNQQIRIDALVELFDNLRHTQQSLQDIAQRIQTLQMQPFWSHKMIAELAEPILRD